MVIGIPDNWHFILASRSPRRQQLLNELGLEFEVIIKEYVENYPMDLSGADIAEYLAREKAAQFKGKISDNEIVITADTVVWCNNMVLDKPSNYKEAFEILRIISGQKHDVITGVTFLSKLCEHTFSETTRVTFDYLTDEEINFYIQEFKPFDKAGGYGIQEWIGLVGIISIEGSYFNVMGLPVQKLYIELKKYLQNINYLK
jgi:septum formation protein